MPESNAELKNSPIIQKCYVVLTGKCIPTFRKDRTVLTFTVKESSTLLGLTDSDDKDVTILRSARNCLPVDTAMKFQKTSIFGNTAVRSSNVEMINRMLKHTVPFIQVNKNIK